MSLKVMCEGLRADVHFLGLKEQRPEHILRAHCPCVSGVSDVSIAKAIGTIGRRKSLAGRSITHHNKYRDHLDPFHLDPIARDPRKHVVRRPRA